MMDEISFVIPVYNEAENIDSVIRSCKSIAQSISKRYEIIVVNDGSTDRTRDIVEGIAAEDNNVLLVHHEKNRGIAHATRNGLAAARYQHIFYSDGDGQFDLSEIHKLLPYSENFDFVVGFRTNRCDAIHRRINTFLYNKIMHWFFHLPVRDVDCAFKLMKKKSLDSLTIHSNSAFYLAELLIRAIQSGMTIHEVPVHHYPRRFGQSSGGSMMVITKALRDLLLFLFRQKSDDEK
jgi:glycosyltransferase involved in cell wall biosynthesis